MQGIRPPRPRLVVLTTAPVTLDVLCRGQLGYMQKLGFEVIAISSDGPELQNVREREGVATYSVRMIRGISPFKDFTALARLWWLFRKISPTIVHTSTAKAGLLGLVAAIGAGVPVRIYTLRGLMMESRTGMARILWEFIEWFTCLCAHQVFAVSNSVAEIAVRHRLCGQGKIKVLGNGSSNGVDAESLFNPEGIDVQALETLRSNLGLPTYAPVVGFVGRIVSDKGFSQLVAAWSEIRILNNHAFLIVVGEREPHDPVCMADIETLSSDLRVILAGSVSNQEMPYYYALMDVIVLPSYREGLPNVLLEAAAMQVPAVASKVTGCVDAVVDGFTGKLVPLHDSLELARAVCLYLDDPELRGIHGWEARQRVLACFRPETLWQSIYKEYLRLHNESRPNLLQ